MPKSTNHDAKARKAKESTPGAAGAMMLGETTCFLSGSMVEIAKQEAEEDLPAGYRLSKALLGQGGQDHLPSEMILQQALLHDIRSLPPRFQPTLPEDISSVGPQEVSEQQKQLPALPPVSSATDRRAVNTAEGSSATVIGPCSMVFEGTICRITFDGRDLGLASISNALVMVGLLLQQPGELYLSLPDLYSVASNMIVRRGKHAELSTTRLSETEQMMEADRRVEVDDSSEVMDSEWSKQEINEGDKSYETQEVIEREIETLKAKIKEAEQIGDANTAERYKKELNKYRFFENSYGRIGDKKVKRNFDDRLVGVNISSIKTSVRRFFVQMEKLDPTLGVHFRACIKTPEEVIGYTQRPRIRWEIEFRKLR